MEIVRGVRGHVVDTSDWTIGCFLPLLSQRLTCATLRFESTLFTFGSLDVLNALIIVNVVRLGNIVTKSSRWQMMRWQVMHVQPGHLLVSWLTGNLSIGTGPVAFRWPRSLNLASNLVAVVHSLARLSNAAALMISSLNGSHTYIVLLRGIRFIGIQHKFTFLVKLFIKWLIMILWVLEVIDKGNVSLTWFWIVNAFIVSSYVFAYHLSLRFYLGVFITLFCQILDFGGSIIAQSRVTWRVIPTRPIGCRFTISRF